MSKIKVLVSADVRHWAYWRRSQILAQHAPPDIGVVSCVHAEIPWGEILAGQFDVWLALCYMSAPGYRQRLDRANCKTPLIVSFNRDRNSRPRELRATLNVSDFVIFNNRDIFDFVSEVFPQHHAKTCNISNGVDMQTFVNRTPITERPPRCIWTGSSGASKGKRYHEVLVPLEKELRKFGIESDFRPINDMNDPTLQTTEQMVDWYNTGSVVVSAALSEGTPNVQLEGVSCGCVPVATYIANIKEYGRDRENCVICEPDVPAFVEGVRYAMEHRERLSAAAHRTFIEGGWDWKDRTQYFYALFRKVAREGVGAVKPFSYMDCTPEEI